MRRAVLLGLLTGLLAGCGVDGPPEPPEPKQKPGVSVTGTVEVGVSGTL
ncbi:MAG: argininosuccinate lyase [Rhodobacter sp.]|nr:argininosuccinate lyase [Rhodobacter sp.]